MSHPSLGGRAVHFILPGRSCSSFLPSLGRVGRLNGRGGADLTCKSPLRPLPRPTLPRESKFRIRYGVAQRESVANA